MAAVVRTTRGDVSLAMSPARDEDDASTSPHLNTSMNSKGEKKAPLDADGDVNIPCREYENDGGSAVAAPNKSEGDIDDEAAEQHKDSPQDAADPNIYSRESTLIFEHNEALGRSSSNANEYIPAKLSVHVGAPSAASSIPHMLGRLSFLGIDAELPSTSLETSVAASYDSDRSEHMQMRPPSLYSLQNTTPIGFQSTQRNQNAFGFDNDHAPSNSNMSSPLGAQSRNANQKMSEQTYLTPPYYIGGTMINTPPHKVSQETLNRQPPQRISEQLQYQLSPEVDRTIEYPSTTVSNTGQSTFEGSLERNEASRVTAQSSEHERKSEPILHHDKRRTRKHPVQPVLYSAINSLEKYNEGSFDNKMLYAKAFGKPDNQKTFPGIPTKKALLKPSESTDSAADTLSSASTALNGRIETTTQTESLHFPLDVSAVGEEQEMAGRDRQQRPANWESALKKVVRSKSSSNLSDRAMNDTDGSIRKDKSDNRVTIVEGDKPKRRKRREKKEKKVGVFRPTGDAYTPRMGTRPIKYKPAQERESVEKMSSTMGTIQRPNFRDALRRVSIIIHQHIVKIEHRFEKRVRGVDDTGLFKSSRRDEFSEDKFATPRYKCSMVRVPMACPGVVFSMRKIRVDYRTPSTDEIYDFAHQLFKKVQLSSECSIVCLIYVEKLMEVAKVPLVASTWRPIFMCGLLLASKVWQDLSSWNIEFASVYPQFSLEAINRLEVQFLKAIKWDLYISSSLYAKYYFALRSLLEKSGFRDRYNQMVGGIGGIAASEAMKVSKRSEAVKEEAILQLSKSM